MTRRQKMNKRQAKKKAKKEADRNRELMEAIEKLSDIAIDIGRSLRDVLDRISETLSQINLAETLKELKEILEETEKEVKDADCN